MRKFSNSDVVFGGDTECREGDSNPQGPKPAGLHLVRENLSDLPGVQPDEREALRELA